MSGNAFLSEAVCASAPTEKPRSATRSRGQLCRGCHVGNIRETLSLATRHRIIGACYTSFNIFVGGRNPPRRSWASAAARTGGLPYQPSAAILSYQRLDANIGSFGGIGNTKLLGLPCPASTADHQALDQLTATTREPDGLGFGPLGTWGGCSSRWSSSLSGLPAVNATAKDLRSTSVASTRAMTGLDSRSAGRFAANRHGGDNGCGNAQPRGMRPGRNSPVSRIASA